MLSALFLICLHGNQTKAPVEQRATAIEQKVDCLLIQRGYSPQPQKVVLVKPKPARKMAARKAKKKK